LLIIFDLDDTLIDTSGCITHFKLEDALRTMVSHGLALPNFAEALELLRRLDSTSESARLSLSEFLEIIGADKAYYEIGIKEIYDHETVQLPLFPLEGALEVLAELGQQHQLALVTMGKPSLQMDKLKKAGIDSRIFSKIAIAEERSKKVHYQSIMDELGYAPSEVIVCGDRVSFDLCPARELGFKTIHMQWGRGLNSVGGKGDVDYRIFELKEIKTIIDDLKS
jgi:putative hydrolase of the HAD superfamily